MELAHVGALLADARKSIRMIGAGVGERRPYAEGVRSWTLHLFSFLFLLIFLVRAADPDERGKMKRGEG